jgi:hypothetical protein
LLAVGAYYESSHATGVDGTRVSDAAPGSGAVYLFEEANGTWTEQAYLKAFNTDNADYFGFDVELEGDVLAVGAYGEASAAQGVDGDAEDDSAPGSGAVYVFRRRDSSWHHAAYLKASNSDAFDYFGLNLALSGDVLAVSAIAESSRATFVDGDQSDNSARGSGAAYAFPIEF